MKTIKVGEDIILDTCLITGQIDQLELLIKTANNPIIGLPCVTPPKPHSTGNCYKYVFYHSYPDLHKSVTAINGEFEIQVKVGSNSYRNADKDITDHVVKMYAYNLSNLLLADYRYSMPGICISVDTELPLYVIQVDIDYSWEE